MAETSHTHVVPITIKSDDPWPYKPDFIKTYIVWTEQQLVQIIVDGNTGNIEDIQPASDTKMPIIERRVKQINDNEFRKWSNVFAKIVKL